MWKVILHFRNKSQTFNFPNKKAAEFFFNTVVFKNEDCINATVVREDVMDLVEKITSKF